MLRCRHRFLKTSPNAAPGALRHLSAKHRAGRNLMITAREILEALRPRQITPRGSPTRFRHAVVDSRKTGRGDLFVALKGERADGHDFVGDAARRGATGAIVERA